MKQTLLSILMFFTLLSYGQNVGINNTDPKSTLDVNGSFRIRPLTLTPVSGIVTVPDDAGYIIITYFSGSVTINASESHIGRRLIIDNTQGQDAFLGSVPVAVPGGIVIEYIVSPTEPGWIKLGEVINPTWNLFGNYGTNPSNKLLRYQRLATT
jgi:hypothetical protein